MPPRPIETERLRIVPATAELVQLEIEDRSVFFAELGVVPASDWPSANTQDALPFFLDELKREPTLVGWMPWYWILHASKPNELVGGGGFKGFPVDGCAEIGYEVREAFRRRGYATEAVGAQVSWALRQHGVRRVRAETSVDNAASIGLLRKLGFQHVGPGTEPGLATYQRGVCKTGFSRLGGR